MAGTSDPFVELRLTGGPRRDRDETSRLEMRFDEMATLPDGWMDGAGASPDRVVLHEARHVLSDLLDRDAPRPRVFPTLEGGVQAEWTVDGHEVSVTFEPGGSLYAISVTPERVCDNPPCLLTTPKGLHSLSCGACRDRS
jgi:hypothetical protein